MRYSFIQENLTPVILCASLLIPTGVLQYYLYTLESSDARVPRFSAVEASLESQRRLVVPITIVTAASANHICSLEAFLYHLNDVLNGLDTSPVQEVSRRVAREQRAIQYVDTSPDMAVIRRRVKKKKISAAHRKSGKSHGSLQGVKSEKRREGSGTGGHSSIVYEIRPKVVVYSLGMGPTKRKRRIFRALVEAGYMDEVYDFDFDRYPAFWALGTETRGEYGWKAGIIDEVSQRFLGTQPSSSSLFEKRDTSHHTKARIELIGNEAVKTVQEDLEEVELQPQAAGDSQDDEGTLSEEDNEALNELEEQELEQREEEETEQGIQEQNTIEQQLQQGTPQFQQPQQTDTTSTEKTMPSSLPTPHEPGIVLWLDSGDRISVELLRWLPSFMLRHGLWTPQSQDALWTWTHPGMLAYFHDTLDRFSRNETNCNGAAFALDVRNATVREGILRKWVDCAKTKECIAPEGSSRANHRQDQAALTYLVKTMGYTDVCVGFPEVYSVQVNQDKFCKEDIAENVDRVIPRI
ncbi:hypothetical protein CPB97_000219 [Podila verticillata]|nr:hypothetical protein CPB97_000219 [Podila verticillata]